MICGDCPSLLQSNTTGRYFCERSEEEVMPDWDCADDVTEGEE
jgi:hypothetical protein